MALWKDGGFRENGWTIVADGEPVPTDGKTIVSLKRWRDERASLAQRNAPLGLLIEPGSAWADIAGDLPRFPVIALTIPKYADGRAFSIARLLRERDGFEGEIRAVGAYIIDQVPLQTGKDVEIALEKTDPQAKEDKTDGTLEWELELPPGQKKTLSFTYSVSHPKDSKLWQRSEPAVNH